MQQEVVGEKPHTIEIKIVIDQDDSPDYEKFDTVKLFLNVEDKNNTVPGMGSITGGYFNHPQSKSR